MSVSPWLATGMGQDKAQEAKGVLWGILDYCYADGRRGEIPLPLGQGVLSLNLAIL